MALLLAAVALAEALPAEVDALLACDDAVLAEALALLALVPAAVSLVAALPADVEAWLA